MSTIETFQRFQDSFDMGSLFALIGDIRAPIYTADGNRVTIYLGNGLKL